MIFLATNIDTGTRHAMVTDDAYTLRPGPEGLPTACGRTVSGSIGIGDTDAVTCSDCRSKPLHLAIYRVPEVGETVTVRPYGLLQYGAPRAAVEQPRAWEDNTITGSWSRGVIIARQAIDAGELSAAVVWPTGTGNYAVNGWRA